MLIVLCILAAIVLSVVIMGFSVWLPYRRSHNEISAWKSLLITTIICGALCLDVWFLYMLLF